MQHPKLTYRCHSRSDRHELHTITVDELTVLCSCIGTDFCSHIDATLIHGERHMVPFEEWDTADQAQGIMRRHLKAPRHWKAHWLEDRIWRGLASPRKTAMMRAIEAGRPTICFIGDGQLGTRFDYTHEADHLGWQVLDTPTKLLTLAVCSKAGLSSKRAQAAANLDLPLLSYEDWEEHAVEFTEQILSRIEALQITQDDDQNRIAA